MLKIMKRKISENYQKRKFNGPCIEEKMLSFSSYQEIQIKQELIAFITCYIGKD